MTTAEFGDRPHDGLMLWALALSGGLALGVVWPGAVPFVVLLVLSPLIEEAVFRVGLADTLFRRGVAPWLVIVLTAAAFGAAHAVVRNDLAAIAVALPALVIGAVHAQWRRLRWCVLLHAAMNAVWFVWATAGRPAATFWP